MATTTGSWQRKRDHHPSLLWMIAATAVLVTAALRPASRTAVPDRADAPRKSGQGKSARIRSTGPTDFRRAAETNRGRDATAPSDIEAPGWKDILARVWAGIGENRVMAIAAGIAFFALLAIFPAIAALVSLYGLFADPAAIGTHLDAVAGFVPAEGIGILRDQMSRVAAQASSALGLTFLISLGIALWSANGGTKALFDALNVVYREPEKRSFVKLTLVTLFFTICGILMFLVAMAAMVVVPIVLGFVGLTGVAETLVRLLRWPILLVGIAFGLALVYRFGPSRERPKWRWITWGSAFAAVAWVGASMLFSFYAANFASYNETYGSLGAVIGFATWIWLSAIVILVGGQINAEIEHQTARDSTTGAPRPMGARGATMADTVGKAHG